MKKTLTFIGAVIVALCGGCATPITHLYDGAPLPLDEVAILDCACWRNCKNAVPTSFTAVDGKEIIGHPPYAVRPGTHTVTAYGGDPILIVAATGISTTPEMRTSKDSTLCVTVTMKGEAPVTISFDDKRYLQAIKDLKSSTMRTVSFTAEAGKRYVVRCELTEDFKLAERGVWIEELVSSKP